MFSGLCLQNQILPPYFYILLRRQETQTRLTLHLITLEARIQPVIFTKQGCMAAEAVAVLHGIAAAVASCENLNAAEVREEFLKRISEIP